MVSVAEYRRIKASYMVYTEVSNQKNGKMVQGVLDIENIKPIRCKSKGQTNRKTENSSCKGMTQNMGRPGRNTKRVGLRIGMGFQAGLRQGYSFRGAIQEVQEATPSNAVMITQSTNNEGRYGNGDHLDGRNKGVPVSSQFQQRFESFLPNVSNEGGRLCGLLFHFNRDIVPGDSASWLPIGYFTEIGDTGHYPFKETLMRRIPDL